LRSIDVLMDPAFPAPRGPAAACVRAWAGEKANAGVMPYGNARENRDAGLAYRATLGEGLARGESFAGGAHAAAIRASSRFMRGAGANFARYFDLSGEAVVFPSAVGRRLATLAACSALAATGLAFVLREPPAEPLRAMRGVALWAERARSVSDEEVDGAACDQNALDRGLVLPTGEPTALACDDARTVVQQARTSMAAEVAAIDAAKFAEATADWLDPHGLWSIAPDAPAGVAVRKSGDRLLAELQARPGAGPCATATEIGTELAAWSGELRAIFDQGSREGADRVTAHSVAEAWRLAQATPFEDGAVTRSARDLARELGREVGALRAAYGPAVAPYADAARKRAAPELAADGWSRVVTAAALRAYIPQLDAHGAWAPLDEEISIYDLALEADPPERLWTEMTRTAIGVRIERGALPPLADGDVVLKVQDVPLAGVSVEQAEQLSVIADARPGTKARVTVLRAREAAPIDLVVTATGSAVTSPEAPPSELSVDLVRYGDGRTAVITIADVPDDLGARLSAALTRARAARDLRGVVLDLRANGGGSTDGAIAALGLFMPGVQLFPMRRRDGEVEVDRAPDVPADKRYTGPLAVLVDGDSASAAEMMAGGLASYRRAVVIGDRTYGKGCAQEYLDDDAHAGVLRLTTLLFCLPDGSPVQKVGILPQVHLTLPAATEREAMVPRALDPWKGPDVRDPSRIKDVLWPNHGGRVGPCKDAVLCRALRALGATREAAR
jgi:carboxyl-terminal processing protease